MRNILLSSAAVLAFAGSAAADVYITGDAELGFNDEVEGGIYYGVGLTIKASQELNNGLTAAFSLDVDFSDDDAGSGSTPFDLGTVSTSDFVLSLSTDMWGVHFGDTSVASDKHWSGVTNMNDDSFDENGDSGEDAVLRVDYGMGGIDVSVSHLVTGGSTGGLSFGAAADLGGVTIVAAYQDSDFVSGEVMGVSAAATLSGIDLMIAFADATSANSSTGISAAYGMGAVTVSGFFVLEDLEADNYGGKIEYSEGAVSADAFWHGGGDEDAGVNISVDAGSGIMVHAGWSDDDGSYVGGTLDLGNGATLLVSWADDPDTPVAPFNDEIGPEEYLQGANINFSYTFDM